MRNLLQISSSAANDGSSDSPFISKEAYLRKRKQRRPRGGSEEEDDDETEDDIEGNDDDDDEEEDTPEHEMEYCDPCYCYGKCCLDIVASIFCVSLL